MSFVAVAIGGSAVIGGAVGLISAGKQADAATDAASVQAAAQREGLAFQREQAGRAETLLREERERFEPFRLSQLRAIGTLEGLADPNSREAQLERDFAVKSLQRTLSAQGLLRSAAQPAGLANIELGLATRRANILSLLAGTGAGATSAGFGQNTAGTILNNGQAVGSSIAGIGQTLGAGRLGAGQAGAQGLVSVNNAIQGGVGNLLQLELLRKLGGKAA